VTCTIRYLKREGNGKFIAIARVVVIFSWLVNQLAVALVLSRCCQIQIA
jgi:hypothetical protein